MDDSTGNTKYLRLVRLWLVTILLILPFQMVLSTYVSQWSSKAATIINNLDELTVVIFVLVAAGEFYKLRRLPDRIFFFYSPRWSFSVSQDSCPVLSMAMPSI